MNSSTPQISGNDFLKQHAIVKLIDCHQQLECAILQLLNADLIGIDIETEKLSDHPLAGLIPCISKIRLVQLYDGKICYVIDNRKLGLRWLEQLQNKCFVAHNAQFEDCHLVYAEVALTTLHCSMLMARTLVGKDNLSLADLSFEALDVVIDKSLQVSDWGAQSLSSEQIQYAALDAVLTFKLFHQFQKLMAIPEAQHYQETYDFLLALQRPTTKQLLLGIEVDEKAHHLVIDEWKRLQAAALLELSSLGLMARPDDNNEYKALKKQGKRFISSAKDKQTILSENLSDDILADWPRTDSGGLKTDATTLATLENHPSLRAMGVYSAFDSKLSNYGEKLSELMINGKIYPNYRIAGMITGRFSCTKPNLQNQPRSGFKYIYRAPEGHVFVGADLAQVELRVAGLLSNDPVIIESYEKGIDLHTAMAEDIKSKMSPDKYQSELDKFSGDESKLMKHLRQGAKGVNFGLLYGSGAKGLQGYCKNTYGVELTLEEAEEYITIFHHKYARLTQWQNQIVTHSRLHREVESPYSRLTRHFDDKDYYNKNGSKTEPFTVCMNYPVQSGAWEILALAIIYIDKHAPDGVQISHHVYDELVLICPEAKKAEASQLLYDGFAHGYQTVFPQCSVKGICEVSWGYNWSEMNNPIDIIEL